MSSDAVFSAVRGFLEGAFTDAPMVWPNEGDTPDSSMPWVYVDVTGTLLAPIELGGGSYAEVGTVWCHVYVPVGTGTLEARRLAKTLSNLFRAAPRDSPVRYGDQNIGLGEQGDDDGMFWRLSLTVDYQYQDRS